MTLDSVDLEKSDRQSVRLRPGWSWEIWCAKRHMVLLARVRDLISTPNCSQKNSTGAITSCLKLASNWVTPPSGPRCCSLDDPQVVGFVLCHVQGEMHFSTVYLLQVCMYVSISGLHLMSSLAEQEIIPYHFPISRRKEDLNQRCPKQRQISTVFFQPLKAGTALPVVVLGRGSSITIIPKVSVLVLQ